MKEGCLGTWTRFEICGFEFLPLFLYIFLAILELPLSCIDNLELITTQRGPFGPYNVIHPRICML